LSEWCFGIALTLTEIFNIGYMPRFAGWHLDPRDETKQHVAVGSVLSFTESVAAKRPCLGSEGGQAAIFGVLTLSLMFATMGLSVDLGWAYFIKQRVQTAADAAASAAVVYALGNNDACGVGGVTCGTSYTCAGVKPPTNSLQEGCLFATADGPPAFTAKMYEYDSAHPPSGVSGVTPSIWIQATVSASSPNLFLFGSGFQTASITANAIGGVNNAGNAGNCIYALSAANPAITDSGSGNITSTCGIQDNGGLSYSASGNITSAQIYVNGNFTDTGSGNITSTPAGTAKIQVGGTYSNTGSGTVSPAHTAGTSVITDPFVGVPAPSVVGCDHTNFSISDASSHTGASALNPGVYCGGLSLSGSGNIAFNSGTYIINGGGATYSFNYTGSGNLTGSNVTFFITGQNGYTAEPINISGSGNLTFSAPSSGNYMGLLFYQDRGVTYATSNNYSGSGNVTGSFYFKTTTLNYSGSGNALAQALVCNKIVFTGSGNLTKDLTGTLTGLVRSSAALIQ